MTARNAHPSRGTRGSAAEVPWRRRLRRQPDSPAPLYEQIKAQVLDAIAEGLWRSGDRLPSETDLADALGASRLTVHRALRELVAVGSLRRVHGVGTFVAPPRPDSLFVRLHNIAAEIRTRGEVFSSHVERLERVTAGAPLGEVFGVAADAPLFHSVIVYAGDGVPLQLEDRYVLPGFAPRYLEQDFSDRSTTDYLHAIAPATDAEYVIEAILADSRERRRLKIARDEPCLRIGRKTWVGQRVTTWTQFLHPGARHRIVLRKTLAGDLR